MFTSLRLILVALLISGGFAAAFATGADARDRHRHGRHNDGFDLGDAIIGAAVLGAIIGLANGAKKNRDERRGERLPPAPYPEERYPGSQDDRGDAGWNSSDEWARVDPDYANRFPSERAAIDACAREAEALGSRYGADARVSLIEKVTRDERDYRVTGSIESREDDYRPSTSSFTCFADGGRVTGFQFG